MEIRRIADAQENFGVFWRDPRSGSHVGGWGTIASDGAFQLTTYDEDAPSDTLLVMRILMTGGVSIDADGLLELAGIWSPEVGGPLEVHAREQQFTIGPARIAPRYIVEEELDECRSVFARLPAIVPVTTDSVPEGWDTFNIVVDSMIRNDIPLYTDGGCFPDLSSEIRTSTYETTYEVGTATSRILSVALSVYWYGAGAAHGNEHAFSVTWDLDRAQPIPLAALFRPGVDYKSILWPLIAERLIRGGFGDSTDESCDWEWPEQGERGDHCDTWIVRRDGLRFFFDQYEVAAGSAGIVQVDVPYSELAEVLDPEGPLRSISGSAH